MTIAPEREPSSGEEDDVEEEQDDDVEAGEDDDVATPPSAPHTEAIDPAYAATLRRNQAIGSGAGWLLWIAALSLVNIALVLGRSDFSFAIGLFVSQLIAVLGTTIADQAGLPAIGWASGAVAVIPALVIGALWFGAKDGRPWVLLLAIVAYGLDLALLVAVLGATHDMDIIGVAIHAWALWSLRGAWLASRQSGRSASL